MWLVKIAYRLCWYIRWNGIKVSTKDISNTRFPRPPSNFQPLVLFSPHTHAKMHRLTLAPQTLLRNYVLFVLFCCISSAELLLWFRNQNQFHSCTHARKYKVREHIDVDFLPKWHQIQNFEFGWCSYEIVIFHVVHCSTSFGCCNTDSSRIGVSDSHYNDLILNCCIYDVDSQVCHHIGSTTTESSVARFVSPSFLSVHKCTLHKLMA